MVSAAVDMPRLVLAAPASGAGKTTVTTGLMAAFTARGLRVSPHKVGPDYIDPSYHALATGRPGRNLDAVLCGTHRIAPLFAHGARGAQLAIVEGVMGLFDGIARPRPGEDADHASTAHVARLLDAPVILVVDVSGAARSVAALVAGFRAFDRRIRLAGVILNRIGSPRHRDLLTEALADIAVPVFGAVPREQAVYTPSRHLGLVPAAERASAAVTAVDRLGALMASACDLDALLRVARSAPPLRTLRWEPAAVITEARRPLMDPGRPRTESESESELELELESELAAGAETGAGAGMDRAALGASASPVGSGRSAVSGRPPRIAVAGGAAFTFGYPEQVELLAAAGARIVSFDPLRDETLPAGTDALIIGGGFPEEHVAALSGNERLRAEVAAFAARRGPILAECAGLLYLARALDGAPMCGVLDVDAAMGPRLTLGYRHATAATDSPLAAAGTPVSAHEFHRTVLLPASERSRPPQVQGDRPRPDGQPPISAAAGRSHQPDRSIEGPAWWLSAGATEPPSAGGRRSSAGRVRKPGDPARATEDEAARATAGLPEGFVRGAVHASYLHLHWAGVPRAADRLLAAAHAASLIEFGPAGPDAGAADPVVRRTA